MIMHADVYAYTQGYFTLPFNIYCYLKVYPHVLFRLLCLG